MTEKLLGALRSRTMWFSLALAVLGVVQAHTGLLTAYLSPEQHGWFVAAVAMAVAVLRWITALPLDQRSNG